MVNFFCFFCGCVDQASVGIVEKWGRFLKLAQPGLNFFNPFAGECVSGVLSTRICSLEVKIETKTKDNVFVQMHCSIQYRVIRANADDAFYELQNPKEQIQAYVFDVVRAHVPKMSLDELFEQKGDVAQAVSEELEKVMGAYGYNIEQILMVDIVPDPSVRRAMNEINAAQRMQLASVYKGEAEKILQVKRAEAEAENILKTSERKKGRNLKGKTKNPKAQKKKNAEGKKGRETLVCSMAEEPQAQTISGDK